MIHDGLARGLRECAKALDKRQAHLCVLNESCKFPPLPSPLHSQFESRLMCGFDWFCVGTEAEYVKLIEALCAEHKINLIKVCPLLLFPDLEDGTNFFFGNVSIDLRP